MLALLLPICVAAAGSLCSIARDANLISIGERVLYTFTVVEPTAVAGVFTETAHAYWLNARPAFPGDKTSVTVPCTPANHETLVFVSFTGFAIAFTVWLYCYNDKIHIAPWSTLAK